MKRTQHGMSLVEVLVAVAIGLIGILIITQAYLASDSFNRSTIGEGGAQTNGTIALFTVQRDLRMAGYGLADSRALGCGDLNWYFDPNYSGNLRGSLPNPTLPPAPQPLSPGGKYPASRPECLSAALPTTPIAATQKIATSPNRRPSPSRRVNSDVFPARPSCLNSDDQ